VSVDQLPHVVLMLPLQSQPRARTFPSMEAVERAHLAIEIEGRARPGNMYILGAGRS
jgi:hypothetical protein